MKTEVILMRHGIAEELEQGMKDKDRALTPKGIEEVLSEVDALKALLLPKRKIVLWHSPLLRSRQTAEILRKKINVQRMESHTFITDGDLELLKKALEAVQSDEQVIIVGHEPHLSNWTEALAEVRCSYKKGAAAGFELKRQERLQMTLLWLCQPRALRRLGKKEEDL